MFGQKKRTEITGTKVGTMPELIIQSFVEQYSPRYPWSYLYGIADVIYFTIVLLNDLQIHTTNRRELLKLCYELVQSGRASNFTSEEAKTPLATYSSCFTKAMRNCKGRPIGKLNGFIISQSESAQYSDYFAAIRPGSWNDVKLHFVNMIEQRMKQSSLKKIPSLQDYFQFSAHTGGLIACRHIKAHSQTWVYYMGAFQFIWALSPANKNNYRSIRGLPLIVIDPTDGSIDGRISPSNKELFPGAFIRTTRDKKKANCLWKDNPSARWQVELWVGKKDLFPGQELLHYLR